MTVTLLEVNKLAHVLCALIILFLWWRKPKQINKPTLLRGRWVREIGAYMFMSSQVSGWKSQNPGILKKAWVKLEFSARLPSSWPASQRRAINYLPIVYSLTDLSVRPLHRQSQLAMQPKSRAPSNFEGSCLSPPTEMKSKVPLLISIIFKRSLAVELLIAGTSQPGPLTDTLP